MSTRFPLIPLMEIASPVERLETPIAGKIYRQLGVKLWGVGAYERESIDGSQTKYKQLSRVETDDIVVNKIWARSGSVAVVPDSLSGCFVSGEFPTFVPDKKRLNPRWFHWFTTTRPFWTQCEEKSQGTSGQNRIRPEQFLKVEIPLPTLSEQRRIVGRIEELAAKIEEARELRQLALKETDLLSSIISICPLSNSKWPYYTIEELVGRANLKNGKSIKATDQPSKIRCLTLSSMRAGLIDCAESKHIDMTISEAKPYLVHKGDVFIVRGNGSKDLVGRAGIVSEECKGIIFPDLFIQVPLKQDEVLGEFFVSVWNSKRMRDAIIDKAKTTSGIWKINQGHIASFSIPVPALDEQRAVIQYLHGLQSKLDSLKQLQVETAVELDALMPAILDRAFKGEL